MEKEEYPMPLASPAAHKMDEDAPLVQFDDSRYDRDAKSSLNQILSSLP